MTKTFLEELIDESHIDLKLVINNRAYNVQLNEVVSKLNLKADKRIPFVAHFVISDTRFSKSVAEYFEMVIKYTGDRFVLSYKDYNEEYPNLSRAAFELAIKLLYKNKFQILEDEEIILFSDEVITYKSIIFNEIHRFPRNFWTSLDKAHLKAMNKFFVEFCCGYNKYNVRELTMKDIHKWNAVQLLLLNGSLYNIAKSVFPEVTPWEMIYVSKGTYSDFDNREGAIKNTMLYFRLYTVDDITAKHLQSICPGVHGYYARNGGIKALRSEMRHLDVKRRQRI